MIAPGTYSTSFYNAAAPRAAVPSSVSPALNDAADAAAAADFARILNEASAAPAQSSNPVATPPAKTSAAPSPPDGGHSFLSILKTVFDVINPLQHIPVIGAIYRHFTGDEISPMAHLAGDALYGGPIGGAIAIADIAYQKSTGKDIGETVLASLTGGKNNSPAATTPAGTTTAQNDIIWSTNSPLPQNMAAGGGQPVLHSTPTQAPVFPTNGSVPIFQSQTASKMDSTTAIRMQKASASAARTAAPPELIASKMMEGLDKYAAMLSQQAPDTSTMSGIY